MGKGREKGDEVGWEGRKGMEKGREVEGKGE